LIDVASLTKTYTIDNQRIDVLKDITFSVPKAKFYVIRGPSGSGKTTILNIIGGIDKPTSGKITIQEQELTEKDEDSLSDFRCNTVGYVFQSYNLVSTLTVSENIAFPMEWTRKPASEILKRVSELLETIGLMNRAYHFPSQLSGGEQQRVAFARALANDPPIILADEPTGNLDEKNVEKIIQILRNLREQEKTIIIATHEPQISELADQVLYLKDGHLASSNE
jgi:putative ABC transport system ATP-binding protein